MFLGGVHNQLRTGDCVVEPTSCSASGLRVAPSMARWARSLNVCLQPTSDIVFQVVVLHKAVLLTFSSSRPGNGEPRCERDLALAAAGCSQSRKAGAREKQRPEQMEVSWCATQAPLDPKERRTGARRRGWGTAFRRRPWQGGARPGCRGCWSGERRPERDEECANCYFLIQRLIHFWLTCPEVLGALNNGGVFGRSWQESAGRSHLAICPNQPQVSIVQFNFNWGCLKHYCLRLLALYGHAGPCPAGIGLLQSQRRRREKPAIRKSTISKPPNSNGRVICCHAIVQRTLPPDETAPSFADRY